MKKRKIVLLSALIISASACGGGGGGGGDNFYAGIWRGVALLERNNCGVEVENDILFEHTVNQSDKRVVLDTGRITLSGDVNEEDTGFTVAGNVVPPFLANPSTACRSDAAIGYFEVNGDEATVAFLYRVTCTNGVTSEVCDIGYAGAAVRD